MRTFCCLAVILTLPLTNAFCGHGDTDGSPCTLSYSSPVVSLAPEFSNRIPHLLHLLYLLTLSDKTRGNKYTLDLFPPCWTRWTHHVVRCPSLPQTSSLYPPPFSNLPSLAKKDRYGITDGGCNGWKYGGGVHVPSLNLVVGIPLCAEAFLTIDTRTNALKATSPVPEGDTGINKYSS